MIVLDASVVVEMLLDSGRGQRVRSELSPMHQPLLVPHLLDVEVASALRKLTAGQRVEAHRCKELLADLADLPMERYPHSPLLSRIWELRHNFTAYDSAYIALAEMTGSILYTMDVKLIRGHRARVRLVADEETICQPTGAGEDLTPARRPAPRTPPSRR